jgi:hypothetical protein
MARIRFSLNPSRSCDGWTVLPKLGSNPITSAVATIVVSEGRPVDRRDTPAKAIRSNAKWEEAYARGPEEGTFRS